MTEPQLELTKVATGVYMDVHDPNSVLINPDEILVENEMEQTEELRMATYHALAGQYNEAGYYTVLLDNKGGGSNA